MDEHRIAKIVEQVVAKLSTDTRSAPAIVSSLGGFVGGRGVHPTVDAAVTAAGRAYEALSEISLKDRKRYIDALRQTSLNALETMSQMAVDETGLGRVSDKIEKNRLVAEKTPGIEALQPTTWTGDDGLTLTEYAPYGIIGSITPCTNPTETILNNGIGMLAAGNAVVFNTHPNAKRLSAWYIDLLNGAIEGCGGPSNVFNCVAEPTIESAQQLMHHGDIRLLVVTGGGGVVKAAMQSGKRAIAAGPGNPPVVVDETADISRAARDLVFGASLDNNIICIVEKEIIAVADIADALKREMIAHHAVEVRGRDLKRLEQLLITPDNHVNRDYIGKNAAVILADAGIRAPDSTRLAFAEVDEKHPFVQHEMLMPVLGFVRAPNVDEAINCAVRVEHGYGHTSVMHSTNINALSKMARAANTSIFVKNAPSAAGVGLNGEGFTSWTIASPTGEGMTWAAHFARARRCVLKDSFRIVWDEVCMSIPTGPAIGLIELCSVARGLQVCDAMVKRAAVQIVRSTTTHPGKYMILIRGGVDEVHEALQAGRALARDAFIDMFELPNPHEQLNTVLDQVQQPQIQSIGIFECYSIASTIRGADAALKAADISACKIQLADGLGGKGYFLFSGELFDVEAAMENAIHAIGEGLLAAQEIIPRPHPDFVDVLTSTIR